MYYKNYIYYFFIGVRGLELMQLRTHTHHKSHNYIYNFPCVKGTNFAFVNGSGCTDPTGRAKLGPNPVSFHKIV